MRGINVIKELRDFQDNTIMPKASILEAMKKLDEQSIKVLFVIDDKGKLKAALTDGDIRRAILDGAELSYEVDAVSNKNPISVDYTTPVMEVGRIMDQKGISAIPVVEDGRISKIYYKGYEGVDRSETHMDIPIVLMAGGKGTRLYPYTKILPKPLIPIEDIPISERIIRSFENVGCRNFYMIVNYKKNMIKAYYADVEICGEMTFVDEEFPLGTGGGVKLLQGIVKTTFVLTNCDILITEDASKIYMHHIKEKNDVTMVCSLKNYEIPYGIVNFSKGGEIASLEEKPHMSFFTNTGYYILEPEVMDYIGDNEHIDMPDIIEKMRHAGKRIGVYPISENAWMDMGQFDSMESMERRFSSFNRINSMEMK